MFCELKNTLLKSLNISDDKVVNITYNLLVKFQKSFTSDYIVKSFKKLESHMEVLEMLSTEKFFMVDKNIIDQYKREIIGIKPDSFDTPKRKVIKVDLDKQSLICQ